jgi:hypothetical protein
MSRMIWIAPALGVEGRFESLKQVVDRVSQVFDFVARPRRASRSLRLRSLMCCVAVISSHTPAERASVQLRDWSSTAHDHVPRSVIAVVGPDHPWLSPTTGRAERFPDPGAPLGCLYASPETRHLEPDARAHLYIRGRA